MHKTIHFKNTKAGYGLVARFLHWGMALVIFAMFGLGLWMRNLGFYSPWYHAAPDIHKAVGIILFVALCGRLLWRLFNVKPDDSFLKPLERSVSSLVHRVFYALLFVQMFAGYLISTLGGRSIAVFSLFEIPSVITQKQYVETVGLAHEYMAYGLMALIFIHAAAALKHHFIDGDATLKRMLSSS